MKVTNTPHKPATILALLQSMGIEIFVAPHTYYGPFPEKLRIVSSRPLTKGIRKLIAENKKQIAEYICQDAYPAEREELKQSGKGDDGRLNHADVRWRMLLPPPIPSTEWELMIDGYSSRGRKPWASLPATEKQINYIIKLSGVTPPDDATKGECSYVLNRLTISYNK